MPRRHQKPEENGERSNGSAGRHEVAVALYGLLAAAVRQEPRDISLTGAATLATLDRTGPRRVTDLAAGEGVAQPSMTALVIGLEEAGLVERRRGSTDQRVVLVSLTPAGRRYLESRRRAAAEALAELMEKLSPAEAGTLVAAIPALDRLRELDQERRAGFRDVPLQRRASQPAQGYMEQERWTTPRHSLTN
jgi:DNA-binding MarR family transcriptional regulator